MIHDKKEGQTLKSFCFSFTSFEKGMIIIIGGEFGKSLESSNFIKAVASP